MPYGQSKLQMFINLHMMLQILLLILHKKVEIALIISEQLKNIWSTSTYSCIYVSINDNHYKILYLEHFKMRVKYWEGFREMETPL